MSQRNLRKALILGGQRVPFVKSFGPYMEVSNTEMLSFCVSALVERFNLKGKVLGDVAFGAVMQHPSDWNLTREVVLGSGLHPDTPGYNVQRACGTGLETAAQLALKIAAGQMESGIAGGSDTNSDLPVVWKRGAVGKMLKLRSAKNLLEQLKGALDFRPGDLAPLFPAVMEPRTKLSMGEHTELMVKIWKISREEQDQLAYDSHQKAARAYEEGFYKDLVLPFHGVEKDAFVRPDTSLEKLGKLKPAFDFTGAGTLTAGNSTPLTDGASAVLLGSEEWAAQQGLTPLAELEDAETAAVDFVEGKEGLLMAPAMAVARLLARNRLTFQDFDFFEIHEAFAGQVLCTLKAWESQEYCTKVLGQKGALGPIDRKRMNLKGGSLALGHPFAATGGRILSSLSKILTQKGQGRGLISICTAGGMGVAAILKRS